MIRPCKLRKQRKTIPILSTMLSRIPRAASAFFRSRLSRQQPRTSCIRCYSQRKSVTIMGEDDIAVLSTPVVGGTTTTDEADTAISHPPQTSFAQEAEELLNRSVETGDPAVLAVHLARTATARRVAGSTKQFFDERPTSKKWFVGAAKLAAFAAVPLPGVSQAVGHAAEQVANGDFESAAEMLRRSPDEKNEK